MVLSIESSVCLAWFVLYKIDSHLVKGAKHVLTELTHTATPHSE
jgi:hypothetical protein